MSACIVETLKLLDLAEVKNVKMLNIIASSMPVICYRAIETRKDALTLRFECLIEEC